MEIKQGEIYWTHLGSVRGHEQAGLRPVIVIQCNPLNRMLNTVMIIPMTSNLRVNNPIITQFVPQNVSGLKRDSVALLHQIQAIDKRKLLKKAGAISKKDYFEIRFKLIQNIWCA